MTSSNESCPKIETVKPNTSKKNKVKCGGKIEVNDEYLDEILHINNLYRELAMQIIFNFQTVRSNTIQDLKEFNSQILAIQAKKRTISCYDACY